MKLVRARPGRLVPVLLILAGMALGRYFGVGADKPSVVSGALTPSGGESASRLRPVSAEPASARSGLELPAATEAGHRAQIIRVVEAMDRTGSPPAGVAQGGRRGGRKGAFQNAEGRLPRKAPDYWIESDVWPKNGPRDAERLIFGREREVYWTRDHYETFVRLR